MKALSFYDLSEERQQIALKELQKDYGYELYSHYLLVIAREAVYCPMDAIVVKGDWVKR